MLTYFQFSEAVRVYCLGLVETRTYLTRLKYAFEKKNILAFNKAAAIQVGEISAITTTTIEYG